MLAAQLPNTSCDIGPYFKSAIVLATVPCASRIAPYQRYTINLVDNTTDDHSAMATLQILLDKRFASDGQFVITVRFAVLGCTKASRSRLRDRVGSDGPYTVYITKR